MFSWISKVAKAFDVSDGPPPPPVGSCAGWNDQYPRCPEPPPPPPYDPECTSYTRGAAPPLPPGHPLHSQAKKPPFPGPPPGESKRSPSWLKWIVDDVIPGSMERGARFTLYIDFPDGTTSRIHF